MTVSLKQQLQRVALAVLCWTLLVGALPAGAQVFLPDDPLWEDPDRLDAPAPQSHEVSDPAEFVQYSFKRADTEEGPAMNVNTLGEVPNSSWYTNRHYWDPMSIEELRQGPDVVDGPSMEDEWEIVAAKTEGKSLGMQIVDARGDRYLLKFDPMRYPELSSGAEVIVTKFLYALGYHVPQNFVAYFQREDLRLGEDAIEEGIDQASIDEILAQVPQEDGRYRAMASKFIAGEKPLGPFRMHGTRPDDANDVIPHELRRELRGLRLVAAWFDHIDIRSSNSLDMLVSEDGRQYVRHHLLDFGTTLGGGPISVKRRWFGHEYILEPWRVLQRAVSLGFWGSSWVDIDYPEHLRGVGYFEAEHFDPRTWRPQYPNPAFSNADADDHFWAAKKIMNFTDEEVRALVGTGQYTEPASADYLANTLIERRDRIGQAYLDHGGGLDRFAVEGGQLTFVDLPAKYGWADSDRERHVIWRPFDNRSGETGERLQAGTRQGTRLAVPDTDHAYLEAEIRTPQQGVTRVYLRRQGGGYEVVGIERE